MDNNNWEDVKVGATLLFGSVMAVCAVVSLIYDDFGNAFGFTCVGGIPAIYLLYKLFPL